MRRGIVCALVPVLLAAAACRRSEWKPILGETSYDVVTDQLERMQTGLDRLEQALAEPARREVADELNEIRLPLTHLRQFYVPVLQAREQCLGAYRLTYLKRPSEARELLSAAKSQLELAARADQPTVRERMQELIAMIDRVEQDMEVAQDELAQAFEELLRELEMTYLRGDLILSS